MATVKSRRQPGRESKKGQRYSHGIWIAWTPINQQWFLLQGKGPNDSIILDRFMTRVEAARAAERLTEKRGDENPWNPGSRRDLNVRRLERSLMPKRRDPNDDDLSSEALELLLFLDNDEPLYRRKREFLKNVYTKMKRGTYNPTLAIKLWMYYVEEAAKKYEKEYLSRGEWSKVFPPPVRREVAKELEERERQMIERGEYEDFPPVRVLHDPSNRRSR